MVSYLNKFKKFKLPGDEIALKKNYDELFEVLKLDLSNHLCTFTDEKQTFLIQNIALVHLKSNDVEISQRALFFLGFLLSRPKTEENVEEYEASIILDEICNNPQISTSKTIVQRCLWCLATQKLNKKFVLQKFNDILSFVQCVIISSSQESSVSPIICSEIVSVFEMLNETSEAVFFKKRNVWLPLLIKFCVSPSNAVREKTIDFFEKISLPLEQNDFIVVKEGIKKSMPEFVKLIPENGVFAFRLWKFFVNLFGEALQKSTSLLNVLLPPIEIAFKSDDQNLKCLAFEAWACLIKTLSSSNIAYINEPKRLCLLMQPLIVGSKRTERVAMEQVRTWVVIMNAFGTALETVFDQVCAPLLRFCVGGECEAVPLDSSCSSPQLNRSLRVPASPQTPKLYLINADKSVGPKKLPCFPSVQALLGEILLNFTCGPVVVKGFSRSLEYLPSKPCVHSSATVSKHFSLISQCLRIWVASASKNDDVLLKCWEALAQAVVQSKVDLPVVSFDTLAECFMSQLGQFLDECALESRTKTALLKFKEDVAAASLEFVVNNVITRVMSQDLSKDNEFTTDFNTTEKLVGSLNVIRNDPNLAINTPPSQKRANSNDVSDTNNGRSTRLRKKLNLDRMQNEEEFVYIPPTEKKKAMVLTERQKEKFLERKEMPYLDRTNSQTVEHIDPALFVTESQILEPATFEDINAQINNMQVEDEREVHKDIKYIGENEIRPDMKPGKRKKSLWKKICRPTVLVEKLTDHDIEILSQEKVANANLVKKTIKTYTKKMPKSKSETSLPCRQITSDPDVVLSSQPTDFTDRIYQRRRTNLSPKRSGQNEMTKDDCISCIPDSCPERTDTAEGICEQSCSAVVGNDDECNEINDDERPESPTIEVMTEETIIDSNLVNSNVCRIYPLVEQSPKGSLNESVKRSEESDGQRRRCSLFVTSQTHFSPYRLRSRDSPEGSMTQIRPHPGLTLNATSESVAPNERREGVALNEAIDSVAQNEAVENILHETCENETRALNFLSDGLVADYNLHETLPLTASTNSSPLRQVLAVAIDAVNESDCVLDESDDDFVSTLTENAKRMISPGSTPSAASIMKRRKRPLDDYRPPMSLTPPSTGKRQVHFAPELMSNSDDEMQKIKITPRKRARLDMSPPSEPSSISSKRLFGTPQSLFATKFSARTHAMISRINNNGTKSKQDDFNETSSFASTDDNILLTRDSVLDSSQPIWPSLVDNSTDIVVIVSALVTSSWDVGLLQELHSKNVRTVGNLARLTELEIHHLPIKHPKVKTLKDAFSLFEKNKTTVDLDNSDLNISGVVPMEDDKNEGELDKSKNDEFDKSIENSERNEDLIEEIVENSHEKEGSIKETDENEELMKENVENSSQRREAQNPSDLDNELDCDSMPTEPELLLIEKTFDPETTVTLLNRPSSNGSTSSTTLQSGQPDYTFIQSNTSSLRIDVEAQTDSNVDLIETLVQTLLSDDNLCSLTNDEKVKLFNCFHKGLRYLFNTTLL